MLYEMRLKGREKQGECSTILYMCFFIMTLTVVSVNLLPLVYIFAVKPLIVSANKEALTFTVSAMLLIISAVCLLCLSFGCDRFMLKRAENITAGAGDIFYYFRVKNSLKLISFAFKFTSVKLMLLVALSVPFIICAYTFYVLAADGFSALVCSIFALFSALFFLLSIGTYRKITSYLFTVKYRYIKGEYINFRHLLSSAQLDMKEKINDVRALKRSFIGWFLICFFIIPIPYVWCYYRQTLACFASTQQI